MGGSVRPELDPLEALARVRQRRAAPDPLEALASIRQRRDTEVAVAEPQVPPEPTITPQQRRLRQATTEQLIAGYTPEAPLLRGARGEPAVPPRSREQQLALAQESIGQAPDVTRVAPPAAAPAEAVAPPPELRAQRPGQAPARPSAKAELRQAFYPEEVQERPVIGVGAVTEPAPITFEEAEAATRRRRAHPLGMAEMGLVRDLAGRTALQAVQKVIDWAGEGVGVEAHPYIRQLVDIANRSRQAELAGDPELAYEIGRGLTEIVGAFAVLPGATAGSQIAQRAATGAPRVIGRAGARAVTTRGMAPGLTGRATRRAVEDAARFGYVESALGAAQEEDLEAAAARGRRGMVAGLVIGPAFEGAGEFLRSLELVRLARGRALIGPPEIVRTAQRARARAEAQGRLTRADQEEYARSVLGVREGATEEEISQAFRDRAVPFHEAGRTPDPELFKVYSEAAATLRQRARPQARQPGAPARPQAAPEAAPQRPEAPRAAEPPAPAEPPPPEEALERVRAQRAAQAEAPARRGLRQRIADVVDPARAQRLEQLEVERRSAQRAANTDPLTNLGNRRALDRALPTAEADPETAVIAFDANNFGKVNKLVSQEAGDEMIQEIGAAIQAAAAEAGVGERVFRRGGDEFVVLAPREQADAIRQRAEELFGSRQVEDVEVSLTGTTGDTFTEADAQLQAAKARRKTPPETLAPSAEPAAPVVPEARPEAPPAPARAPEYRPTDVPRETDIPRGRPLEEVRAAARAAEEPPVPVEPEPGMRAAAEELEAELSGEVPARRPERAPRQPRPQHPMDVRNVGAQAFNEALEAMHDAVAGAGGTVEQALQAWESVRKGVASSAVALEDAGLTVTKELVAKMDRLAALDEAVKQADVAAGNLPYDEAKVIRAQLMDRGYTRKQVDEATADLRDGGALVALANEAKLPGYSETPEAARPGPQELAQRAANEARRLSEGEAQAGRKRLISAARDLETGNIDDAATTLRGVLETRGEGETKRGLERIVADIAKIGPAPTALPGQPVAPTEAAAQIPGEEAPRAELPAAPRGEPGQQPAGPVPRPEAERGVEGAPRRPPAGRQPTAPADRPGLEGPAPVQPGGVEQRAGGVGGVAPADRPGDRPERPGARAGERAGRAVNYRADDPAALQAERSLKQKATDNVAAIRLLKQIEAEQRPATPEEQQQLARYIGWGGMPQMFETWNREWGTLAKELREQLTDREYEAARASTPNAHYTSPEVVSAVWDAMQHLGYEGGKLLEPGMGAGYFLSLIPEDLAGVTGFTGVELDDVTGRIARLLFPRSDIRVQGFEDFQVPDGFYDAAVGNVPFGDYRLHDPRYNKYRFSIHDYFFAKALDKVRPGGVVAFITSRYSLDRGATAVRKYLAERADLIGAIRLPNTAFKKVANTEVTTDIVFLRKRHPDEPAGGEAWLNLKEVSPGIKVNEYYASHPGMMLGTMELTGTMYRGQEPTLAPKPGNLAEQMREAIAELPQDIMEQAPRSVTDLRSPETIAPSGTAKEGAFVVQGDKLLRQVGGQLVPAQTADGKVLQGKTLRRVKALVGLRDAARDVLATQVGNAPDAEIRQAQQTLQKVYGQFVKRYGPVNKLSGVRRINLEGFRDDPDAPLVAALENVDDEAGTFVKADLFTKRVIRPPRPVETVEAPEDALIAVLNERGRVDLERMSHLTGSSEEHLIEALEGQIFRNPETEAWEQADLYLSGNVRHKLAMAKGAAQADPTYQPNVEALEQVQPEDLQPSEIDAAPGATWIEPDDVAQFVADLLNDGRGVGSSVRVFHNPTLAEWKVEVHAQIARRPSSIQEWGTERVPFPRLLEDALNLREPKVYDRTSDGKSVPNAEQTLAAQEKLQKVKDRFRTWVWEDPARSKRLHRVYNDTYNNTVPFKADGSHLTFAGIAQVVNGKPFQFRPHQKDAVWRILQTGNTLLAHVVGAGKTYVMVSAGMEAKRIGLASKPMYVVPNHMLEQFTRELVQLYPAARVLMATKEDLAKEKRLQFIARVASNEWDAVVVTHSSFGKVPMSPAFEERFIREQLGNLEVALRESEAIQSETRSRKARSMVKQIEKAKKRLEARLLELEARDRKDDLLAFEELGVDMLFVDEAHLFKNLYAPTKMQRVQMGDAQRAMDLYMKATYLNDIKAGKGLVFATGTPISNSIVEMFTMLRYLAPQQLGERGMEHFDAWAATFGDMVTQLELRPEGGFRIHSRFARFRNVPELAQLYRSVADVQTAEMLNLPRPTIRGGQPEVVAAPESDALAAYQANLVKRAEAIRKRAVEPDEDNMLKLTGDGRRAALDMRLVDPNAPDLPDSKVNQAVDRIYRLWQETADSRLTQMVFIDLSTPKPKATGEFSVYGDMRQKLLDRGIPEKEIAFIHDAGTDKAKAALFRKVRQGQVRVLFGSTEKMGMGTNVQDRLIALHHLDAPWRPSDIEQREGRILRQGNQNPEVEVIRYVTEGSFDGYIWQLLETKARFIDQVQRAEAGVRTVEDVDSRAMTFAEIKAIATGNPLVMEKAQVDADVLRLSRLARTHLDRQFKLRQDLATLPERQHALEQVKAHAEADGKTLLDRRGDKFEIRIGNQAYTKRAEAGDALLKAVLALAEKKGTQVHLGTFAGLDLIGEDTLGGANVWLAGELEYATKIGYGSTPLGALQAVEYLPQRVQHAADHAEEQLKELARREKDLKRLAKEPFDRTAELEKLLARQKEIDAALDLDKQRSDMPAQESPDPDSPQGEPVDEPELLKIERQAIDQPALEPGEPDPKGLGDILLEPPLSPPIGLEMPEPAYGADLFELARAIDTPARYKHLRNALGKFDPTESRIEVRDIADLFSLAHEIAHAIDYRLSGNIYPSSIKQRFAGHIPDGITEQALRGELVAVSQFMRPVEGGANNMSAYRRRHSELMSDFYGLHLLNPEVAESLAPNVSAAFASKLTTNPRLHEAVSTAVQARATYGPDEPPVEIRPERDPQSLIPEDIEGDYTDAVKALTKNVPRTFRLMKDRAKQAAQKWRKMVSEEELEDIGAAVEGIDNLRTGKPADEVVEGLTPKQKQILREYRVAQERARQTLNEFMRDVRGDDYVNYLEDYLLHFYVRDKKRMRPFAVRWARNVPSAKARRLPTLQDAVDAGLTPVTQDVATLHELWAEINWRGAINQRFVHELKGMVNADGLPVLMKPKGAPPDWPVVDHPAIRKVYARQRGDVLELWHGGAAIDPEVYKVTRQVFEQPFTGRFVRTVEMFNAWAKWVALSLSMFHHWALTESANAALARVWNPVRGLVTVGRLRGGIPLGFGIKITQPHREGLRLLEDEAVRRDLMMHGVNIDPIPDVMVGRVMRSLREAEVRVRRHPVLGKIPGLERLVRGVRKGKDAFDHALWNRYYTGLKGYVYYDLVREQMARMPADAKPADIRKVKEKVAELVNDMFGGQEWEGKFWLTPKGRQIAHWLLLAPDWTLSNFSVAAKAAAQARDPVARKILWRYWRWMLASFFAFISTAGYALNRRWPWENEPGHKMDIDVTEIMRALPWTDPNEQRRYYIKPGKQFREVVRYVTDPVGIIGPKASPGMHIVFEQMTGHQAGQWGWDMPWVREELTFYESLPARAAAVMEKFTPFAVRGNNFAFTFPMSRGMSWYKAQKAYEHVIRAQVDPSLYRRLMPTRDADRLKAEIDAAATLNGLDPKELYRQANTKVRTQYYGEFWRALDRQDFKEAERVATVLRDLGATRETLEASGERRGVSPEILRRARPQLPTGKRPPWAPSPPRAPRPMRPR